MRSVVSASNRSRMETMTGTFQSDKGGTSIPLLSHPGERDSPHLSSDYFPQPFRRQIFYANRKQCDAYRMHSGWPFSLHTPFPDRWGFEPDIDYQSLPGKKPCVFTDVYGLCFNANTIPVIHKQRHLDDSYRYP